jgi:hypothetical protein
VQAVEPVRERFERWVLDVARCLVARDPSDYEEALEDLTSEEGLAPDPTRGLPAIYAHSDEPEARCYDIAYALYAGAFRARAEGDWLAEEPPRPHLNVVVDPDRLEDEFDAAGVLMGGRDADGNALPPRLVFHAFRAWLKNYTAASEEDLLNLYRLVLSSAVAPYDELPDGDFGGAIAGAPRSGAGEAA